MYTPLTQLNTRIDVVDILRAIAIGGIVVLHFLEHLNFYAFPEPASPLWKSIGDGIWDTAFFLLAGKMYAIFSLLFGLSFFIQHDNQAQKGVDFRLRFVWRMVLLMLFGLFDLLFFNGDILTVYAACGVLVLPLIRAKDAVVKFFFVLLLLQPIELVYMLLGLFRPELEPLNLGSGAMFGALMPAQLEGSLWDVAKAGIWYGFPINFAWAIENGRMTQTVCLFLLGILLGRKRLFYNEGHNLLFWQKTCIGSLVAFLVLLPAFTYLPELVATPVISRSLHTALNMWKNFAMMAFYVSGIVLLYYRRQSVAAALRTLIPYGKMSLTNYLGQSVVGSFLFYHWGLGLYAHCYHTSSFLLGVAFVVLQCVFSCYWAKRHKRGPLEGLWYRLTWLDR